MNLDTAQLTYIGNGSSLRIFANLCSGCGSCLDVCPHAVLELHAQKAVVAARDRCMECGACGLNCPQRAIEVTAGVGCVAAIVNRMLGKSDSECCCSAQERPPNGCVGETHT
jgi:NAD-dependent dihydropyrimidine dehydrogenase PreA subunit